MVSELDHLGAKAMGFSADVRDSAQIAKGLVDVHVAFGDFDVLVSGAAGNLEAKEISMVNGVTIDSELEGIALAKARKIVQQPSGATKAIKQQLKAPFREQFERRILTEFNLFAELLAGGEAKEILSALTKN